MCMFCMRLSQLHVCDARVFDAQLKSVIKDHVFMLFFVYVYVTTGYLRCLCPSCSIKLRDKSSCVYVHVLYTYISNAFFNARVVVFVLQCKSVIRDHTLMCIFCIRISELRVCDVLWNNIGNDVCMCTGVASATQWARM